MCNRLYETARWLNVTAMAVACSQSAMLNDALDAIPADNDRGWVNSEVHAGQDNQSTSGLLLLSLIGKVS